MRTPRQRMGIQPSEENPGSVPATRSTGRSTAGHMPGAGRTAESSVFHTIETSIATLPPPGNVAPPEQEGESLSRKPKRHHRSQSSRPESLRSSKSKSSGRSRKTDGSWHHHSAKDNPNHDYRQKSRSSVRRSLKAVADWQSRNAALSSHSSLGAASDAPPSSSQPDASSGFGCAIPPAAGTLDKHVSRDSAQSTMHVKTGSRAPCEPADPSQASAVAQAKSKAQDLQKSKTAQGARQPSPPLVRPVAHKAKASAASAPVTDQQSTRPSLRALRNQHASSYSATFGTVVPPAAQAPRSPSVPSDMKGSPPSLRSVSRSVVTVMPLDSMY